MVENASERDDFAPPTAQFAVREARRLAANIALVAKGEAPEPFVYKSQGALASLGWFAAMTLESAARVRALGQIEILFTLITSIWWLGERLSWRQAGGLLLVLAGLAVLI